MDATAPAQGKDKTPRAHGLTAVELRDAVAELARTVHGAELLDAAMLRARDDLLLWLRTGSGNKLALHVVPGAVRGRVTLTARRFAKAEFATGPLCDALRAAVVGCCVAGIEQIAGERIARLTLRAPAGEPRAVVVELFGNRGLWALLDAGGRIAVASRVPHSKDRSLTPGSLWVPPPPRPVHDAAASRFTPPVLAAIDAWFTALDQQEEADELRAACASALARAAASAQHKVAGMQQQLAQAADVPALRARADLMLAYAHGVPRGATVMRVPDPDRDGAYVELPLLPDKPVVAQAQALYERARRMEDAREVTRTRLGDAERQRDAIAGWQAQLLAATDFAALAALRDTLAAHKVLKSTTSTPAPRPAPRPANGPPREPYRRFTSIEGHEILCGKTNEGNDRLTLRTARGNDVWLHIGRGYAGSHVVVRVPKGKTASLETLLDAAAIAVHFSKARDADKSEVIYTQAKHVRKPKGAPAGAVIPHQTKTLFVRADQARLRRLLDSSADDA
jgi:predicted ribosome quality control (RQC) complex YloA/Tae2 family protein